MVKKSISSKATTPVEDDDFELVVDEDVSDNDSKVKSNRNSGSGVDKNNENYDSKTETSQLKAKKPVSKKVVQTNSPKPPLITPTRQKIIPSSKNLIFIYA